MGGLLRSLKEEERGRLRVRVGQGLYVLALHDSPFQGDSERQWSEEIVPVDSLSITVIQR